MWLNFDNCVILGDFNAHLEVNCRDSTVLRMLAKSSKLHILKTGCTFYESINDSWLDVVLFDDLTKVSSIVKSVVQFIDFHYSIFFNYKFQVRNIQEHTVTYRDFKNCNYTIMKNQLILAITRGIQDIQHMDEDSTLHNFNSRLIDILDNLAPFCTIQIRPNSKPWLNDDIKYYIRKRNRFYKIYKVTRRPSHLQQYKNQVKIIRLLERQAKYQYYSDLFSEANDNAAVYRILHNLRFANSQKVAKTALDFFQRQDIVNYVASTYSVHPPPRL